MPISPSDYLLFQALKNPAAGPRSNGAYGDVLDPDLYPPRSKEESRAAQASDKTKEGFKKDLQFEDDQNKLNELFGIQKQTPLDIVQGQPQKILASGAPPSILDSIIGSVAKAFLSLDAPGTPTTASGHVESGDKGPLGGSTGYTSQYPMQAADQVVPKGQQPMVIFMPQSEYPTGDKGMHAGGTDVGSGLGSILSMLGTPSNETAVGKSSAEQTNKTTKKGGPSDVPLPKRNPKRKAEADKRKQEAKKQKADDWAARLEDTESMD